MAKATEEKEGESAVGSGQSGGKTIPQPPPAEPKEEEEGKSAVGSGQSEMRGIPPMPPPPHPDDPRQMVVRYKKHRVMCSRCEQLTGEIVRSRGTYADMKCNTCGNSWRGELVEPDDLARKARELVQALKLATPMKVPGIAEPVVVYTKAGRDKIIEDFEAEIGRVEPAYVR